jgi:hypothetical protein
MFFPFLQHIIRNQSPISTLTCGSYMSVSNLFYSPCPPLSLSVLHPLSSLRYPYLLFVADSAPIFLLCQWPKLGSYLLHRCSSLPPPSVTQDRILPPSSLLANNQSPTPLVLLSLLYWQPKQGSIEPRRAGMESWRGRTNSNNNRCSSAKSLARRRS